MWKRIENQVQNQLKEKEIAFEKTTFLLVLFVLILIKMESLLYVVRIVFYYATMAINGITMYIV